MVRADLLDCIDQFLRVNGPRAGAPFGGVQLLFIGDLYQLPPVVLPEEETLFTTHYASPYFFDAHAGSPQYFALPEPQWLPMGYVAARSAVQEYRL